MTYDHTLIDTIRVDADNNSRRNMTLHAGYSRIPSLGIYEPQLETVMVTAGSMSMKGRPTPLDDRPLAKLIAHPTHGPCFYFCQPPDPLEDMLNRRYAARTSHALKYPSPSVKDASRPVALLLGDLQAACLLMLKLFTQNDLRPGPTWWTFPEYRPNQSLPHKTFPPQSRWPSWSVAPHLPTATAPIPVTGFTLNSRELTAQRARDEHARRLI